MAKGSVTWRFGGVPEHKRPAPVVWDGEDVVRGLAIVRGYPNADGTRDLRNGRADWRVVWAAEGSGIWGPGSIGVARRVRAALLRLDVDWQDRDGILALCGQGRWQREVNGVIHRADAGPGCPEDYRRVPAAKALNAEGWIRERVSRGAPPTAEALSALLQQVERCKLVARACTCAKCGRVLDVASAVLFARGGSEWVVCSARCAASMVRGAAEPFEAVVGPAEPSDIWGDA